MEGEIQVMGVQKPEQRERSERDGKDEGELKGEGLGFRHFRDPRALRVILRMEPALRNQALIKRGRDTGLPPLQEVRIQ